MAPVGVVISTFCRSNKLDKLPVTRVILLFPSISTEPIGVFVAAVLMALLTMPGDNPYTSSADASSSISSEVSLAPIMSIWSIPLIPSRPGLIVSLNVLSSSVWLIPSFAYATK
ncbi:hypothetical protein D3C85_1583200 [compost metagenome]